MVYGVFGGHYSDWFVEGYFETEEEAQKYCAMKNSIKGRWQDDLYVIPLNKLNAEGDGKPFLYEFLLDVSIDRRSGKIHLPDTNDDETFYHYDDAVIIRTTEYSSQPRRPRIEFTGRYGYTLWFRVHIYSENLEPPKKLCKIALDEMTMEISSQEERDSDWMDKLPTTNSLTEDYELNYRTLSNKNNIKWQKEE